MTPLEALREFVALIDSGVLVRDISRDHEEGWAFRQLPLVRALQSARAAIAEAEKAPVPLTYEQIDTMWREPMSADWEHREFARAIERAHGIGEKP